MEKEFWCARTGDWYQGDYEPGERTYQPITAEELAKEEMLYAQQQKATEEGYELVF